EYVHSTSCTYYLSNSKIRPAYVKISTVLRLYPHSLVRTDVYKKLAKNLLTKMRVLRASLEWRCRVQTLGWECSYGWMRSVPGAIATGSMHPTRSRFRGRDPVATAPGTDLILLCRKQASLLPRTTGRTCCGAPSTARALQAVKSK